MKRRKPPSKDARLLWALSNELKVPAARLQGLVSAGLLLREAEIDGMGMYSRAKAEVLLRATGDIVD